MAKKPKKSKKDKAANTGTDAPKKKSGIIGQLALAIALGAASFGTITFLPGNEPAPLLEETATEHKINTQPDYEFKDSASFVTLSPFTLTLNGGTSLLKIGITLEVNGHSAEIIDPDDPQIRDAFTGYLRALDLKQINDTAFMAQIRSQLLHRVRLINDPETIQGVLITDFLVR